MGVTLKMPWKSNLRKRATEATGITRLFFRNCQIRPDNKFYFVLALSMYVFRYRGCPSWNCPLLRAVQLSLGDRPINKVGPMSQPRGTIDTASRMLYHTHALNVRFLTQLYSRQLRVTCTLMCRGAESHRPVLALSV